MPMNISHTWKYGLITTLLLWMGIGMCDAQTKRALIIGISQYPHTTTLSWGDIHGTNDADLIAPTLKAQGYKTTIVKGKAATAKTIRQKLSQLTSVCKKGDWVYIHFSGHGQPFEDLDGDEEDGWDESIVPYDAPIAYQKGRYEGSKHIIDDELHTYFSKIQKAIGSNGLLCVVIDACHSGGASRGEEGADDEESETFIRGTSQAFSPSGKTYRPRINRNGHFRISKKSGEADIIVLEACRSYQSNYEIQQAGRYYGPLSFYTSQALKKKKIGRNLDWVIEIKKMMDSDCRLIRQNMVYETSIK